MRKIILLLFLFVLTSVHAQNGTNTDTTSKRVKINIKAEANKLKAIPVNTLDSFGVNKMPKTEIKVVKNQLHPTSASLLNTVVYVIKTQFQEKPISMLIITALLFFGIIGIIKQFSKK